jgi:hypothetical protein
MKTKLAQIFDELLREVQTNPDLRARVERHFASHVQETGSQPGQTSRPKNRRGPPAIDPYAEIKQGEQYLRDRLAHLNIDQLKDVVSAYALDGSRLALKWKDQARLVDLIVATVRSRIEKGDVFREDSQQAT